MEYGDNVLDLALRLRIHLLMQSLRQEAIPGVAELAPGVRSLQIRYDSRLISGPTCCSACWRANGRWGRQPPEGADAHRLAADGVRGFGHAGRGGSLSADGARFGARLPNNVDFIQRINGLSRREQVRDILFDASYLILGLGTSTSARPARCRSIRAIAC